MKIKPIILSGGSGVRLWPLSREKQAKQFVDIFNNDSSLFLDTLLRIKNKHFSKPIIVSNTIHRFDVLKTLKKANIFIDKIILEHSQKNTAPATILGSYFADDNDILCIMPSDHFIKNNTKFLNSIMQAADIAKNNKLVSLGVICNEANTNYGYIIPDTLSKEKGLIKVRSFIEKPNRSKANQLLKKKVFWNTGIVVVKNSFLKSLFEKFSKQMYQTTIMSCNKSKTDREFVLPEILMWNKINPISFDYAIMEKKFNKYVVPIKSKWSDLGTFDSLKKIKKKSGNVLNINSENCMTYSNEKLLITAGVKNLIVINTKNAILVTNEEPSSHIRAVVKKLVKLNRQEAFTNSEENRPWGSFETIQSGKNYKVKKLLILPGEKISLQKHLKRSEHWVVVEGKAKITKGKKIYNLNTNESIFISKKEIHRIENVTKKNLIIIEVQTGSYLEEDDIIRIEDKYKR